MKNEGALRQRSEPVRLGCRASYRGRPVESAAVAFLLHVALCWALIVAAYRPDVLAVPDELGVAMVFVAPVVAEPAVAPVPPDVAPEVPVAAPPVPPDVAPPAPPDRPAAEAAPRRPSVAAVRKPAPARAVAAPAGTPEAVVAAQPAREIPEPEAVIAMDWQRSLGSWLEAHKSYPYEARRRGTEGRVGLRFTVERSGRVMTVAVVSSAGSPLLDNAATALVRNATLPPFTAAMPQMQVTLTVQIQYALTN